MTDFEKSPGAESVEAKGFDVVGYLHTILPRSSQSLALLLRETEEPLKKQILQALSYYVRRGLPDEIYFRVAIEDCPENGTLLEMDFHGERTKVLILNWRPSIVFDLTSFNEIVDAIWQSDHARDDMIYCLRNWRGCKHEFNNAESRGEILEELAKEHDNFGTLMQPLMDAPSDPRRWLSAPPASCPIYVGCLPSGKVVR